MNRPLSLTGHLISIKNMYESSNKNISITDIIEDYLESIDNIIDIDDLILAINSQQVWKDYFKKEMKRFNIYDRNSEVVEENKTRSLF